MGSKKNITGSEISRKELTRKNRPGIPDDLTRPTRFMWETN